MAFNFLKKRELLRINELESNISLLKSEKSSLETENHSLKDEIDSLKYVINELKGKNKDLEKYKNIADLENEKEKLSNEIILLKETANNKIESLNSEVKEKEKEIIDLSHIISEKKNEIVRLDDTILLQEFGLYEPIYDFTTSEGYKEKLSEIRNEQKKLIMDNAAAICSTSWEINGSLSKGKTFINKNIKHVIRSFNNECDVLISKVKFNNVEAYIHKIVKSYDDLNKLNSPNCISISESYLNAKLKELRLSYEYALKKQMEKEEQRARREEMREEAKLMEEIEQKRKEVIKELAHYNRQISRINELIPKATDDEFEYLNKKKKYIEDRLNELDREVKEMDYREANKRAGYVYVISNIGAFGEDVYKIGMTRRLEPMDRIDELSNASVPFKFDVHAMIFSDDAPKLESALHKAFDNKKINMVNNRKEFFKVKIDEIEKVVKSNYDKIIEFTKTPIAEQYRETLKIIDKNNL